MHRGIKEMNKCAECGNRIWPTDVEVPEVEGNWPIN